MRALAFLLAMSLPAAAQTALEVDVELALMVDVSRSMAPSEIEIQRRGYAEAIRSPEVMAAVEGGLLGQVALTYIEWAGDGATRVIAPWTVITSPAEAEAFASMIDESFGTGMRRTSISGAITLAADSIASNPYEGLRRVIDISGDGPNNSGAPVTQSRDAALRRGLTINGLPLMTRDGRHQTWDIDHLDAYYRDCVIGGMGAFVIPVTDWAGFETAVRRKLVLEIAGLTPPAPTRLQKAQMTDCLIGEKIRQERRRYWEDQ
ncbi:DUF1194 domain-containing protein [Vannielia sp.]|uniref:DUF1194 domain-containing protein n=1 Tax=Vannielia sp. TaxID=2813045 RepID=UPI00260AC21D|nr:DUF1194 domain-containing protein [Vannielia sp.]MDF1872115.1 DUF1194 domain-containing protein [Vannielia sp.]